MLCELNVLFSLALLQPSNALVITILKICILTITFTALALIIKDNMQINLGVVLENAKHYTANPVLTITHAE